MIIYSRSRSTLCAFVWSMLFFVYMCCASPITQNPLIIDDDCSVDGFIAMLLQFIHSPERVKAITIVPCDCYPKPAVWIAHKLRNLFLPQHPEISVGVGIDEGVNLFPAEWREHVRSLANIPLLKDEKALNDFSLTTIPNAVDVLIQVLDNATTPADILETGSFANIAELLHQRPDLKNKIGRIFMIGGAEWNMFNNPPAFFEVLQSRIPITMIALDATNYTPVKHEFLKQMKQRKDVSKSFRFVYEGLRVEQGQVDNGMYHFWGVLTSAVIINPDIVQTKKVKINIKLDGPSMGKTFEDSEHGFEVDFAVSADRDLLVKTILDVLHEYRKTAQP